MLEQREKNKITHDRLLLIVKLGDIDQSLKVQYIRAWESHHIKEGAYV